MVSFRKGICVVELQIELASFFHEVPFLLERLNDKLLFKLRYLTYIFLKLNKVSLLLQRKL